MLARLRHLAARSLAAPPTPLVIRGGRRGPDPLELRLAGGRIAALGPRVERAPGDAELELDGEQLLPGLVNAHDHLHLDVCPRTGEGPYRNAYLWSAEFPARHFAALGRFLALPAEDRYAWGGLRNLLSGATWVAHHDPWAPTLGEPDFPVRVAWPYGQVTSLRQGDARAAHARRRGGPFFIHLAEGTDDVSGGELSLLQALGGLGPETVLVHGVGLLAEDRETLLRTGAWLACCPTSNRFLLGQVPRVSGIESRLLVGTDSTLSGAPHLLEELRVARAAFGFTPGELLGVATTRAASALRLPLGAGRLEVGAPAHVIALRTAQPDPAEAVLAARPRDVVLAVVDGHVRAAGPGVGLGGVQGELTGAVQVEGEVRRVRPADARVVQRIARTVPEAAPGWFGC